MTSSIRWNALLPVIGCISAVGLSLGLSIPLVSLTLEYRGTDSRLIGIMAAMPALGILFFSPFVPRLMSLVRARAALGYSIVTGGLSILLLPLLPDYRIWLVLRFVMGAANAVLFVVSETWVNQIAEEHNRGKLIAIYIAVLSLCFSLGPLLISLTGSQGTLPFLLACAIFFVSAIPLSWARSHMPPIESSTDANVFGFFLIAPTLCSAVLLFAFLDGAVISLLPVFGVRHGYNEAVAAMMITVLIAGNILLQFPIGWLADRMDRYTLQFFCGCGVLLGSLLLPFLVHRPLLFWPMLVLLGVSAGGVYTLSMIIVGQRFQGVQLVTANAAFGVLWGIGSLAGPMAAGFGMRLLNPDGLPFTLALAAMLFLAVFIGRRLYEARTMIQPDRRSG